MSVVLFVLLTFPPQPVAPQIVNPIDPLYVVWSDTKPEPIPGYVWAENIYFTRTGLGISDVPSWGIYRTQYSPPNNKALFKRLKVSPEEVWRSGRWDDTDYVP